MPDLDYIIKLVNDQKNSAAWQAKANLMDEALGIWNLEEYLSEEGKTALQGKAHFTSNEPRTFADMAVGMLSESQIIAWIPLLDQKEGEREVDAQKERFIAGIRKAADERLESLLLPRLQDIASWQSALRGRLAGRWVLVTPLDKEKPTYVDIMPWDSRYVYWGMGPKGLKWVCREVWKQVEDIEAEYEISLDSEKDKVSEQGLLVYDWYDDKVNMVRTAEKVLKQATPHGSPRIPVALSFAGAILPLSGENGQFILRGQDIYHSNREVYQMENFLGGAHFTRVGWQVDPNIVWPSKMGDKTPPQDDIMAGRGKNIPIVQGEEPKPLQLPEMSEEAMLVDNKVSSMRQKGSFTEVVSGQAPFPMPGVAIDRLREPMKMVLSPCEKAIVSFYRQGIRLICDQYAKGAFSPFEVSGRDRQRRYFRETITPEMVAQGGEIEVRMALNLPKDETKNWAIAMQARTPDANGVPEVSHGYRLEHIIGVEDVDLELSAIKTEMASRYSPWVMAYELMLAEVKQGNFLQADVYLAQVLIEIAKKMMEMQQFGVQPPQSLLDMKREMEGIQAQRAQQPQSWPLNKGFPPTVLHGAEVENPPGYNPAVGPQVPAGTPRPGRMTEGERMMGMPLGGPEEK